MILTISGLHGTGKSTIGKRIAQRLGIRYYSSGQAFRELATEMGVTIEEFTRHVENNPSIDKKSLLLEEKKIALLPPLSSSFVKEINTFLILNELQE